METMTVREVHADAVAHFARLRRIHQRLRLRWLAAYLRADTGACRLYAAASDALTQREHQAARDMRAAADALIAAHGVLTP